MNPLDEDHIDTFDELFCDKAIDNPTIETFVLDFSAHDTVEAKHAAVSKFIGTIMHVDDHPERIDYVKRTPEGSEPDLGLIMFGLMFQGMHRLYLLFKMNKHLFPGEFGRVERIAVIFHYLEYGILTELGHKLEPMDRKDSQEVGQAKLAKLDKGKALFKKKLIDEFTTNIKDTADRNLILRWAGKLYRKVHGFQAPPRLSAEQAMRDAMGSSDHYLEMVIEIMNKVESSDKKTRKKGTGETEEE